MIALVLFVCPVWQRTNGHNPPGQECVRLSGKHARFSFRCTVQGAAVPVPQGFLLMGFLLTLEAFAPPASSGSNEVFSVQGHHCAKLPCTEV